MVNTNMWEAQGGSIILKALVGASPVAGMALVCGPLHWDEKQGGTTGRWPTGAGPQEISIEISFPLLGATLDGYTGRCVRGFNPPSSAYAVPYSSSAVDFWAVTIPLTADQHDELKRIANGNGNIMVTGEKTYLNFTGTPDDLDWHENLKVRIAR